MNIVFDKAWFEKYQGRLLWLLNTPIVKYWFRWVMCIHTFDVPLATRITVIAPNHFSFGDHYICKGNDYTLIRKTDFRTHDKFSKRLYYAFKPFWYLLHFFDWAMLDRVKALTHLSFGFTTLTQFPSSIGAGNPSDGMVGFSNANGGSDWNTTHNANPGDTANPQGNPTDDYAFRIRYISGSNVALYRSIFCFDTSAITTGNTVFSAILSLNSSANKIDQIGLTPNFDIYASTPVSTSALAVADYAQIGTVSQTGAATPYASLSNSTGTYQDFTLNATGISNISKTGISKFGGRNQDHDVANVDPAFSSGPATSGWFIAFSGTTGTSKDPKLVVTYGIPAVAGKLNPTLLLMNVG